jgi:hypothetical protein
LNFALNESRVRYSEEDDYEFDQSYENNLYIPMDDVMRVNNIEKDENNVEHYVARFIVSFEFLIVV